MPARPRERCLPDCEHKADGRTRAHDAGPRHSRGGLAAAMPGAETFRASASAYDRFVGRYGPELATALLRDHVTLQVRSVDRLFLQGYVPRLQTEGQLIRFLLDRGFPIPSPAALGKIGRGYVAAIDRFALIDEIPVVRFAKGDVKEEIAREYFKVPSSEGRYGVVLVGVAQEKTSAWRGWRDGGPDGHPHFEYRRQSMFPNHYYFYIRDPDWGPSFIKTIAYAPFSVWIYLNGQRVGQAAGRPAGDRVQRPG